MATVLIIDDDQILLELLRITVASLGHVAVTACNGAQALVIIGTGAKIDALVTDIDLGDGPSGMAVATVAARLNPRIRVVYMSAAPATAVMRSLMTADSRFLRKPYTSEQFVSVLLGVASQPDRDGGTSTCSRQHASAPAGQSELSGV